MGFEAVADMGLPPFGIGTLWAAARAGPRHGVVRMRGGNVGQKGGNFVRGGVGKGGGGEWGLRAWWGQAVGEYGRPTWLPDEAGSSRDIPSPQQKTSVAILR